MELSWLFSNLTWRALVDIGLVALLFFAVSYFIRGTQAITLVRGIVLVAVIGVVAALAFDLRAMRWLLENALPYILISLPIIFQPELRRALEQVGRASLTLDRQPASDVRARITEHICQAVEKLSERRHGALIVLERGSSLQEYIRTGVRLDSEVNPQLLLTIFWPKTELHDGAVIIDWTGRLASAAAVLPLSASRNLTTPKMGTRHRAALGISEVSDAICVVVSEETGRISIAQGGKLISRLDPNRLRTILHAFYGDDRSSPQTLRGRLVEFVRALTQRRPDGRTSPL